MSSVILIPGWATDRRVFSTLDLGHDRIIPADFPPHTFERELLEILKQKNIKKVSLFGWSMGGTLAADLAAKYPELIHSLILIGVKRRYSKEDLDKVREYVRQNRVGYLYKFYSRCFAPGKAITWFKKNLLRPYCDRFETDTLLQGLDYLEHAEIKPSTLKGIPNITIIHGTEDRIAPIEEALALQKEIPNAKFVRVENAGHATFLEEDLSKYI